MTGVINTAAPNGGLVKCCAILLAVLAAHFLVSCGTSDEPSSTTAAVEPDIVLVGVVVSVDSNRVALATLDGTISVTLSDESIIQEFAAGSLENLSIGQRVTIMGQGPRPGWPPDRLSSP